MEQQIAPPGEPSSRADGSQGEPSDEQERYGSDVGAQNTFRSRKRTKFGRYISDITLEEVQQYTNLPAHVACERLGLGLTSFKRLCRGLGISAWPYKKDASMPSAAYASDYASGSFNSHKHNGFAWNPHSHHPNAAAGTTAPRPGVPLSFASYRHDSNAQFGYAPPHLPPRGQQQESLLHNLCRDATPSSLAQIMSQFKQLSTEMRDALGLSIIHDDAVDQIISACAAMETSSSTPQPPPPPQPGANPAAALMAILAQVRGSLEQH